MICKKKSILILAVVSALVISLTACGSSEVQDSAPQINETFSASATESSPSAAEPEMAAAEPAAVSDATAITDVSASEEANPEASAAEADESTAPEDPEVPEASLPEENQVYDTSVQYASQILSDGAELIGGTYTAEGTDESVLEASGDVQATVTGAVLKKASGDASSADDSSFRGVNAGVRVYGDAEVTLTDCQIEADAENATGVFAYENGVIHISDSVISVTGGGAGGVQVAGGGTLYGSNLTVTSASKAAIRSDRGGGVLVIDGGSYTSTGSNGCPAIYSTADISVSNADCVSTNSRAVIIEGKNSVTLENCTLTGNDQSTKEGSVRANVLLYQSASGDASEGTSVFTMKGGSMVSQSGAMFYCTNTASEINLTEADLTLSEDNSLLIVSAGRWGKDGQNGGKCTLNANSQTLEGSISVDAISTLAVNLTESEFTGTIQGEGTVDVAMDSGSEWTLTGDSEISSLQGDLTGLNLNGYTLYVDGEAYTP